jgi:hypothetical protein
MSENITDQITSLKDQTLETLQSRYKEVFATDKILSTNKVFLWRRIAYRLQEQEYGELPQEVKDRIESLIQQYDPVNNKALRPTVTSAGKEVVALPSMRDKRLPIPGTVIHKRYKGQDIQVRVMEKGFEYNKKYYKTLSAISEEITGAHWNGYSFFNL